MARYFVEPQGTRCFPSARHAPIWFNDLGVRLRLRKQSHVEVEVEIEIDNSHYRYYHRKYGVSESRSSLKMVDLPAP